MDTIKCAVCRCTILRPKPDQTKCAKCNKDHPDAATYEDLKREQEGLELSLTRADVVEMIEAAIPNKEEIKQWVTERLMDLLTVKTCECGKQFVPASPAQKKCSACRKGEE